jgi:hypothetical protein
MGRKISPITAVLVAAFLFFSLAWALDVDLGADFYDRGFARGDALNFKFKAIKDAFALNFPVASSPQRFEFTATTATTTFSWAAASYTYDPADGRLHVFLDGCQQWPDTDYEQTSATSLKFDAPVLAGTRVALWRM